MDHSAGDGVVKWRGPKEDCGIHGVGSVANEQLGSEPQAVEPGSYFGPPIQ